MSSCFPLGARWKCFSFDPQDPLKPRILRSARLHTSSTLRSSKLPACVARLPPWQSGRRTRPWHQRPHCRTLRSSSMHSCSSQFHVIDGFSPLHPHNNHITTPQWQRLHAVPARMKRCAGPCASASWATAPWMFQRNIPWKRCWPCLPIFFAKARVDKCMNFSAWPLTFPWFLVSARSPRHKRNACNLEPFF